MQPKSKGGEQHDADDVTQKRHAHHEARDAIPLLFLLSSVAPVRSRSSRPGILRARIFRASTGLIRDGVGGDIVTLSLAAALLSVIVGSKRRVVDLSPFVEKIAKAFLGPRIFINVIPRLCFFTFAASPLTVPEIIEVVFWSQVLAAAARILLYPAIASHSFLP